MDLGGYHHKKGNEEGIKKKPTVNRSTPKGKTFKRFQGHETHRRDSLGKKINRGKRKYKAERHQIRSRLKIILDNCQLGDY